MKKSLTATIATFFITFAMSPVFAADHDEETLKSLEQTWIAAVSTTDRAMLDKILDDAYVETTPSGARRGKSDAMLASPPPPGSSQALTDVDVRVTGDTAIVTGTNHFLPTATSKPVDYLFTDVFVRRAEGWRVVSSQMTRR